MPYLENCNQRQTAGLYYVCRVNSHHQLSTRTCHEARIWKFINNDLHLLEESRSEEEKKFFFIVLDLFQGIDHNHQCLIVVGWCKERSGDAYAEQADFQGWVRLGVGSGYVPG